MHTADYCPLTSRIQFDCSMGGPYEKKELEFFGQDSRCITTDLERPLCLKFECNEHIRRAVIHFDDFDSIICENEGDMMPLPGYSGGNLECPNFEAVCPQ